MDKIKTMWVLGSTPILATKLIIHVNMIFIIYCVYERYNKKNIT